MAPATLQALGSALLRALVLRVLVALLALRPLLLVVLALLALAGLTLVFPIHLFLIGVFALLLVGGILASHCPSLYRATHSVADRNIGSRE